MRIEDAFLHDILAHPDDDAPRLIYADWLDEHNDPRGEFIRLQCALAQLSDEDPHRWPLELREQELLSGHEERWLPKGISKTQCAFRRGFVEEITLYLESFLDRADRLFEQVPIRRLSLQGPGWVRIPDSHRPLTLAASSPHLARIQRLSLSNLSLSRSELHEFLISPYLQQLTDLELSSLAVGNDERPQSGPNALPLEIVQQLTELPCRTELKAIRLTHTALTLDGLRALANSSSLTSLRELNLNGNRLTHEGARVLAEGRLLPQLETLHLDSNLFGDAGALIVSEWPVLPHLTRLSLRHNQFFAAGVQALAEAQALRELISLDLFGNISCDDGAVALACSNWMRLQALSLWFNGVGDKGVRALAQSKALSQLTRLNLTANHVTSTGARALIESPHLPRLARLDLLRNDVGEVERQRLRDRFGPFVYC
jgi:uncharacterized protein (TIGR02996 family)